MKNSDIEYLEECLKHTSEHHSILESKKLWYSSDDIMLTIARILDDDGCFQNTSDVINFFEKPWKYESDMIDIVKTYNEEFAHEHTQVKTETQGVP